MIEVFLKKRREINEIKEKISEIFNEKIGDYNKIEKIIKFKNENKNKEDIIIKILKKNKSVKLYNEVKKNITINDFLEIEKNKYYIFLAKEYSLIKLENIERIHNIMPEKIKKLYIFKKINKEAYNKNVRFKN